MSVFSEVIYRWLFISLIVLICFFVLKAIVLKGFLDSRKQATLGSIFSKKSYFFTPAERKFYSVLVEAVGDEVIVFGQCRVADLIDVDSKKYFGAFNRIKSKHVDFVLVEKSDFSLLCAIELDDKSHRRFDRVKRDKFLDDLFAQVGLPLFRFKVRSEYSVRDIQEGLGIGM